MNDERAQRDLKTRTKSLALRIVRLYSSLDKNSVEAQVLGKQLLRSGTSVGARYWVASRARSPAEFISKIEMGIQELEETAYWLEVLVEGQMVPENRLINLCHEVRELTAILVSAAKTAKGNLKKMKRAKKKLEAKS